MQNDALYYDNNFNVYPLPYEKKKIRRIYNGIGFALITSEILMYIVSFAVMFIPGNLLEETVNKDGQKIFDVYYVINAFFCPVIAEISTFILFSLIYKLNFKAIFSTKKCSGNFILKAVGASLFLHSIICFIQILMYLGFDGLGLYVETTDFVLDGKGSTLIAELILSVICAPIAEELLYRGFVLRMASKISQRFAIFASALFFGLMHENPYQFVLGFIIGILLAYIDIKAGSIIPSIICHAAMNFMASTSEISDFFAPNASDAVYWTTIILELVVGLIIFVYAIKTDGVKFPEYKPYHKKRTMPIIITSVPVIIITVYFIIECITSLKPYTDNSVADEIADNSVSIIKMLF